MKPFSSLILTHGDKPELSMQRLLYLRWHTAQEKAVISLFSRLIHKY